MPTACKLNPVWVRCPAGPADNSNCLSAEEIAVVQKLYASSTDSGGRQFEMNGFPLGSERMWALSTPTDAGDDQSKPGDDLQYLLPMPEADQPVATLDSAFQFNQQWFDELGVLAPLYNGANTNLRPFQQRGSKLILWHGAADATVQQESSIAYYQGVQKELGTPLTDTFMRFFLLPGMGHCGNGEGPAQFDVLSSLMAWVELNRAPEMIVAGKPANQGTGIPGQGARGGANAAAVRYPFSTPDQPAELKRPVYPFPYVARYTGKGDRNDPSSYQPVKSSVKTPQVLDTQAMKLIGPNNQAFYRVENGNLVIEKRNP
jgi:feruloyl esterase